MPLNFRETADIPLGTSSEVDQPAGQGRAAAPEHLR